MTREEDKAFLKVILALALLTIAGMFAWVAMGMK
jgi:hypothetical protein